MELVDMMKVMEKQSSTKSGRTAKPDKTKPGPQGIKVYPSSTRIGDILSEDVVVVELIDGISVRKVPWQAGSTYVERALSEDALASVIAHATEVIGDREEAMRWLGTPVRGLDFATPISLLATEEGATRVNDILGQMEHGIW